MAETVTDLQGMSAQLTGAGSRCRPAGSPGPAGTIRLKLLKIGALVRVSVRRVTVKMASGHPWQHDWATAHAALTARAG